MSDPKSIELLARAERLIPGGVNSPVRAFRSVGGQPVFITRAEGASLFGADGKQYTDYVGSWGPMILGHAHPAIVEAITVAARNGTSYGAPTELEVRFAEKVIELYPSIEMMRAVSSGTEACMAALRVARGFTGREAIVKFEGCYHGHADFLLVKAGSGALTFGVPDSAGVPSATAKATITAPFNDVAALEKVFAERGSEIAAVIVEPVVGNMGVVPPAPGFLEAILRLCKDHGAVSIFDEVMTGSRVARGGMQERAKLSPDMTCLGKIIGGGMPLAAYGGRRDIMQKVAPIGPVYQAGTLSGNPVAVSAALALLTRLDAGVYDKLEALGARLEAGLVDGAKKAGLDVCVQRVGSMITPFFTKGPVTSFASAVASDTKRFGKWHAAMLARGQYWPPSQFEAAFLSTAHSEAIVDRTIAAAAESFAEAAK
ncbi:MAG: glutamate-1-semialdehyde 2,1-aminomutase [Labilithrix sp.]|nr:glutamate-1-semialdehyde 2,1-aminomutase [Labilithrix sp.]MCW5812202.1 glutamate-1-semialdehyde 2,1-aminomutase [Labilithrix sp.]